MSSDAKEMPVLVVKSIEVFDEVLQGVEVEVQHTDGCWYVRDEYNRWHLTITDVAVEDSKLGIRP